jgi:hypothetical protein
MPARSIFSGPGMTFTMSCTVRVTTDVAGAGELSFLWAGRLAGARLVLVVGAGVATVPVGRATERVRDEPLEELCFLEALLCFLVVPLPARCLTGVVATGVVVTGAAGGGVGVAAVVVTVAAEPELLLKGLFFLLPVVVDVRFFVPLVVGGLGTGVGAATVVTPVESV